MALPGSGSGAGKSSGCWEDECIGASMPLPARDRKVKKRTGLGPHLVGGKSKPIAATNDHQNQLPAFSGEAMRHRNRAPCKWESQKSGQVLVRTWWVERASQLRPLTIIRI